MKPDNAEKIIRDYWGDGNVKDFATAITDVIIESPEKGMSFAAKVMPMTASEEQVNSYKGKLSASMQLRGAPKLPVAIIKVDENSGEAMLGIVLYYQYGTAAIETEIRFLPMETANYARLLDELKAADTVIRFLEMANCKVIKTIKMPLNQNGHDYMARLVYARDLTISYRMKSHEEMTDAERLEYYLKGIPEIDYPVDELDKCMLKTVREQGYKDADMESHLLLFSTELRDLKRIYDMPSKVANFLILPDLSSCPALPQGFPLKDFNVDMFIDNGDWTMFHQRNFSIEITLGSVNDYYDFVDGIKTLVGIKRFIGI